MSPGCWQVHSSWLINETFLKFNSAHDAVDRREITNGCEYISVMAAASGTKGFGYEKISLCTPGFNVRQAKVEMKFGGRCVLVMFDSGCSIASFPFKDSF